MSDGPDKQKGLGSQKAGDLTEKFASAAKGKGLDGQASIRNHKPQQTLEMKGPGGGAVRQDAANQAYAKDKQNMDRSFGEKYAKMDITANKNKSLSQEFNKARGKGLGV